MDTTEERIAFLENLIREHQHNVIDSTSRIPKNKPNIQRVADAATITPKAENDCVDITAIARDFTIANPTGNPQNFDKLIIRIKDNGTARAITWGSEYVSGGPTLPATTSLSKILHLGFIYNTANSLNSWLLVAKAEQT